MRPGNEREKARQAATAKAEDWEPLLEILRSADSAVGAAVHWVESHGGHGDSAATGSLGGGGGRGGKRRKGRELWRFVPELLSSEVVYVEEEEEEEEARRRAGTRVGNCIWMQTLPSAMQTNILTFLNVEHMHFRAKDLELLARCILSPPVDPEFWLVRAATTLLNTSLDDLGIALPSPSKDEYTFVGMEEYNALPDWLYKYTEQQNGSLSLLSRGQSSLSKEAKQVQESDIPSERQEPLQNAKDNFHLGVHLSKQPSLHFSISSSQGNVDNTDDGIKVANVTSSMLELVNETSSLQADNGSDGATSTVHGTEGKDNGHRSPVAKEDLVASADLGDEVFAQALSLKQALRSSQVNGLPKEISLIRLSPKLSTVLSVIRAWEVDDEVTLLLIGSLLTEQDGYAWSTQILQSIFLPKLLDLDKPASRMLTTALVQAAKTHPRATMDALVFPLVCSEAGASSIQCDLLNRIVKDCLPDEVNATLCERMFAAWEAKLDGSRSRGSWVWTDGMVTVVQNLLSHRLHLDQRTIAGLVCALDAAVTEYSTSLKFANLLLKIFTKHGPILKPQKAMLQMVANRSKTFLTKSLLTKLAAM